MFKRWDEFNNEQMEFIKDNHNDKVIEAIYSQIDTELIYDADIEKIVFEYTTITELLNGEYTIENLCEDLFNSYYNESFADIAEVIYNSYLTEEEKAEVDELEV